MRLVVRWLRPCGAPDPFDRLLVARALAEDVPLVTGDPAITRYDVETTW